MATIADLLIKLGADVSGLDSDFAEAPAAADKATDGIASKFEGLGAKLGTIAKAAGLAAGAAVVAGAVIGIEQEAVSDKLAAQLDLTAGESKAAGKIAGSLYADAYGESFGQVNEAVGAVVGTLTDDLADPSAIEDLTAKALDLASAFDLDVNEAVTRAGVLLTTGLAADADHAFDLITASMQEIAPGLRDELGEATAEYSKFFADLGFSGEEMFGLLATADDKFALDKTGDAIKELSIRATDMSTLSVAAFRRMGLDAEDMADRIAAGGAPARAAFDEIVDGLLGIKDPSKQANTAIALFGTPVEDLGVAKIPAFLESLDDMGGGLDDVAGRADSMGDTLNDNAQTKIEGYKRSIELVLARVLELPGVLGQAATGVAAMGSIMAPLAPAMTGLAILFQGQLSKMGASAAKHTTSVVSSVARQVAAWAVLAAQSLASAARVALAWLIAMGPIAIVIAAVIAAVVLIVKNWGRVKKFLSATWKAIRGVTRAAWAKITSSISSAVSTVLGFFRAFPGRAVGALRGLASTVVSFVTRWHPIAVLLRLGRAQLPRLLSWLRGLPGRAVGALGGMANALFHVGRRAMQSLWDGLKSLAGSIASWVSGLASDIKGKLDPRNWFSTPEEHYRMLFGAAFASIPDEARRALNSITVGTRLVAEASVPSTAAGRISGRPAPAAAPAGGPAVNIEGDLVVREELDFERAAAMFGRRLAVRGA